MVPTILTTSPPNGSSNVGDNAYVRFVFSKPINPLTVNASTIQLSGGGVTVVPDSISFSNNNQSVLLVPHAPLPDGTQMTLTVSGVTDVAGNSVAAQTTQFTTETGPDVVPPVVVTASPYQNEQNVPLNSIVMLRMSQPIDPGTVNSSTLSLVNPSNGQIVPGTYSVSADGLTITFVPSAPLAAGSGYYVNFAGNGITDLAGNQLSSSPLYFTTGTTASTSAPQVTGVSPANGTSAVPINAQVVIQFNEPVDAAKLGGVTLSGGSGAVNVSQSLTSGNQRLILLPAVPLSPSTAYTLTIAGVQDLSGNVLSSPVTVSFTTGTGADLTAARIVAVNPAANATGVSASTAVTVSFSKVIDPLTVTTGTMQLIPTSTSIPVAGTVSSRRWISDVHSQRAAGLDDPVRTAAHHGYYRYGRAKPVWWQFQFLFHNDRTGHTGRATGNCFRGSGVRLPRHARRRQRNLFWDFPKWQHGHFQRSSSHPDQLDGHPDLCASAEWSNLRSRRGYGERRGQATVLRLRWTRHRR